MTEEVMLKTSFNYCFHPLLTVSLLALIPMIPSPVATAADSAVKSERIPLLADQPQADTAAGPTDGSPYIEVFHPEKPNGASVVICPGGGYGVLVIEPEGRGIARWLNAHGITGAVLKYRLPKGTPELPLLDANRAIRIVRSRAAELGCDPKRIGIMGFSAGGHLAATAETHFDNGDPGAKDAAGRVSSRPDFAILVYPVITMGELTHGGSRTNLMGPTPSDAMIKRFSNEFQVTDRTPPTFIAHAQDDATVPPVHSQMFYDALLAHHVPAIYLKLPSGGHGLNGYKGPMWDQWQSESLQWLAAQKLIPQAR